jgi:hypothetical protein
MLRSGSGTGIVTVRESWTWWGIVRSGSGTGIVTVRECMDMVGDCQEWERYGNSNSA